MLAPIHCTRPHLLDLEVAQVFRRYTLSGEMSIERTEQALEDLADLPLNRYPHDIFLRRIRSLRRNLTAYDALISLSPKPSMPH